MKQKYLFLILSVVCVSDTPVFAMQFEKENHEKLVLPQALVVMSEKEVEKLHQQMLDSVRDVNDDPICNTLKEKFPAYDSEAPENHKRYKKNIKVLKDENAKSAIREITDGKVGKSAIEIKSRLNLGNAFEGVFLECVKENLFYAVYDKLWSDQSNKLQDAWVN